MDLAANVSAGLKTRAARIGALAGVLVRRMRLLGWLALAAAAWLWLVLFVILGSIPHFLLAVPAAAVGVILLLPGLVLLAATLGLQTLTRLPERLGAAPATQATGAVPKKRRGPIGLLRKLWAIRREMLGYKLVLVRYAGAVRLFTLPVLLVISLAVLACVFQLLLVVLSLPLVLVSLAF
ncbi:MAG: hypothetical protein EA419_00060 [Wenzhouxiangella sp.]|nr:MAG: hypothetical protein EA419_00060 [Wenzhouxiangella sp.]